jgi:hypothetical protein
VIHPTDQPASDFFSDSGDRRRSFEAPVFKWHVM